MKFLDLDGLEYFWGKVKTHVTNAVNSAKTAVGNYTINGKKISSNPTLTPEDLAGLVIDGKIDTSYLPSYVDDVLEYNGDVTTTTIQPSGTGAADIVVYFDTRTKSFVAKSGSSYYSVWGAKNDYASSTQFGESGADKGPVPLAGKIYVNKTKNKTYRWSGSALVEISSSLALGETSSTAFRGDRGKTAYDHAAAKGAAFSSGLYKITTNSQGHVTAATAVEKEDITALGIPGSDTKYSLPTATETVLGGVKLGSNTKQTVAASAVSATSGRTYAVQADSSGKLVVNVPWTADTAITTSEIDGIFS